MKVSAILKTKGDQVQVHTISPESTLKDVVRELLALRVGSLIVADAAGAPVGIITERDLLTSLARMGSQWESVIVGDVMTREVIYGGLNDSLDQVMTVMTERRIRHLPVMEAGKLAGMLSVGDVIKALLNETAFQNRLLKTYIKNWPEES